jgi:hypothetical protein
MLDIATRPVRGCGRAASLAVPLLGRSKMLDGVSARASLGLDPIPGEAPAGVNARYEPEYEELQAEISKFDSGGPRAVDAAKVVRLAQAVLEQKSKDLLVGAFFAYGLVRTDS